jgi:hypothetical protein
MSSIRQQIIAALMVRAKLILTMNGYQTDAGLTVHHGYRRPAKGDTYPRIGMETGPLPDPESQDDTIVRRGWPVTFLGQALVSPDDADSLDAAEDLIADLKKALFDESDRRLGTVLLPNKNVGNVEYGGEGTVDREDGGHVVECWVTCSVTFTETYGDPEST